MKFFKVFFASLLGAFIAGILLLVLLVTVGIGLISSASDKEETIKAKSVLHLTLDGPITERNIDDKFAGFNFLNNESTSALGLDVLRKAIRNAAKDDNIKALYLDLSSVSSGSAALQEIRKELLNFKKSKKPIIAYAEVYTQGAYFLASTADKVYLNPVGVLEFRGVSSQSPFLKGLLAKLEIEAQIIRVGTFKSAIEPLILDKMSDANKLQVQALLEAIYGNYLTQVGESRKINKDSLFAMANELRIRNANDALNNKLIDGIRYKDEVLNELKKIAGTEEKDNLELVSIGTYKDIKPVITPSTSKNKIAIIYANGDISGGEGDADNIGSEGLSSAIRKARMDSKIKAVVLRVNSPGGSALASDVIWREVVLCKKVKPVIVSMGNVAASGGYYIACAADSIFAENNTITGSIGVFGVLPNAQKFFNNKLGVTFDGVKIGQYADLGNINRPLTESEKLILQTEVNHTYEIFTGRVAEGRRMPIEKVKEIAEGRVWSGKDALRIGLIDAIGDLDRAIAAAAKKAKLTEYRTIDLPEVKSTLEKLLGDMKEDSQTKAIKSLVGSNYIYLRELQSIIKMQGVQARMEYVIDIQ